MLLRQAISALDAFRFYSCSLLLIYEGDDVPLCDVPDEEVTTPAVFSIDKGDIKSRHYDVTNPICLALSQSVSVSNSPRPAKRSTSHAHGSPALSQEIPTVVNSSDNPSEAKHEKVDVLKIGAGGDTKKVERSTECISNASSENEKDESQSTNKNLLPHTARKQKKSPRNDVEIRLIDFAHFCSQDPTIHPGPDGGFLYGIDKLLELLRSML